MAFGFTFFFIYLEFMCALINVLIIWGILTDRNSTFEWKEFVISILSLVVLILMFLVSLYSLKRLEKQRPTMGRQVVYLLGLIHILMSLIDLLFNKNVDAFEDMIFAFIGMGIIALTYVVTRKKDKKK